MTAIPEPDFLTLGEGTTATNKLPEEAAFSPQGVVSGFEEAAMNKDDRYITLWRKTGENVLDWDFHVSESLGEAETVVANIKAQGVIQFSTHQLGPKVDALSSEF